MIYTITLNPAIDRTVFVSTINTKDVTRVLKTTRDAAGKGVNVARVIHALDEPVVCLGFLGGENGMFISEELERLGIKNHCIKIQKNTRENIKIVQEENANVIELNESGKKVEEHEIEAFMEHFTQSVSTEDIVILSGSIPNGVPSDIYHRLIKLCNQLEITTILDASGELFAHSITAGPSVIKPNLYELEQYLNESIQCDERVIEIANTFFKHNIKEIIVSMGKDGSIYVSKDIAYRIKGPSVHVRSTVGAGDSFVAGYSVGLQRHMDVKKRLQLATAVATASVETDGTMPGSMTQVYKYKTMINIKEMRKSE